MAPRHQSPDLEAQEDDRLMYDDQPEESDPANFPARPVNHSKTLPFHVLFTTLFNPLTDNNKKKAKTTRGREKQSLTPHERRDIIIRRFISRWRQDVGNDFYPALRLILPGQDSERSVYGLKEKAIAKLLVKMLKIHPKSEDALSLLNWKLPGNNKSVQMAGDFPGRCQEVLAKRAMRTEVGDMRIAEVNARLDRLSRVSKEEDQLPIFDEFYQRMNAEELTWVIRIILRQMKVGATDKTLLDIWHPDGEALFGYTSSLKRVCWELTDPTIRQTKDRGIEPMECFKPQLAQHQMHSFQMMIEKLGCSISGSSENLNFWIEEKLDGERMQLHMQKEADTTRYPGGFRLGFWSRKGKDYTYLYGESFEQEDSSLARFIKDAFDPGVENLILDGEMITWNPVSNTIVGFGTLKTAAISEKTNPFAGTGDRPLFRVFDCLYFNGTDLTGYELKERRRVLNRVLKNVDKRIEIHDYIETTKTDDIEKELRRVVEVSSEGLVLKNPKSTYQLNSRNNDWIKVKPEYMTGHGESLDCVVVGGYYGQGRRGGGHSTFLCGLRVDDNHIELGANPMQTYSFFKVGGGFRAGDYAKIKHMTEGKWMDWDQNKPPTEFIKLGGGDRQLERPDQWIKPCDSFVLEVKAASVGASDSFATGYTLRFPRFKGLREDKNWEDALSIYEFVKLKEMLDAESGSKAFEVDGRRRVAKKLKKEILIAGNDTKIKTPYAGPKTKIFEGLNFCVLSEMLHPIRKTKAAVEQVIQSNGGATFAASTAQDDMLCIGEKRTVPVASLIKSGQTSIIKPAWLFDTIAQAADDGPERSKFLLPFEPGHMFHIADEHLEMVEGNVDMYGDSYARDLSAKALGRLLDEMILPKHSEFDASQFLVELEERDKGLGELPSEIFRRCVVWFISSDPENHHTLGEQDNVGAFILRNQFLFGGGILSDRDEDKRITHFVVTQEDKESSSGIVRTLRKRFAERGGKVPWIVDLEWVRESWVEKTRLDEERFVIAN